jgi:hypothetical protein
MTQRKAPQSDHLTHIAVTAVMFGGVIISRNCCDADDRFPFGTLILKQTKVTENEKKSLKTSRIYKFLLHLNIPVMPRADNAQSAVVTLVPLVSQILRPHRPETNSCRSCTISSIPDRVILSP